MAASSFGLSATPRTIGVRDSAGTVADTCREFVDIDIRRFLVPSQPFRVLRHREDICECRSVSNEVGFPR